MYGKYNSDEQEEKIIKPQPQEKRMITFSLT